MSEQKIPVGYKIEVVVIFDRKIKFSQSFRRKLFQLFEMNIKKWVDISSWNLLKEDDKVYEEEILEIKAKYGDEVTEDQIEGNFRKLFWRNSTIFWLFLTKFYF